MFLKKLIISIVTFILILSFLNCTQNFGATKPDKDGNVLIVSGQAIYMYNVNTKKQIEMEVIKK